MDDHQRSGIKDVEGTVMGASVSVGSFIGKDGLSAVFINVNGSGIVSTIAGARLLAKQVVEWADHGEISNNRRVADAFANDTLARAAKAGGHVWSIYEPGGGRPPDAEEAERIRQAGERQRHMTEPQGEDAAPPAPKGEERVRGRRRTATMQAVVDRIARDKRSARRRERYAERKAAAAAGKAKGRRLRLKTERAAKKRAAIGLPPISESHPAGI